MPPPRTLAFSLRTLAHLVSLFSMLPRSMMASRLNIRFANMRVLVEMEGGKLYWDVATHYGVKPMDIFYPGGQWLMLSDDVSLPGGRWSMLADKRTMTRFLREGQGGGVFFAGVHSDGPKSPNFFQKLMAYFVLRFSKDNQSWSPYLANLVRLSTSVLFRGVGL